MSDYAERLKALEKAKYPDLETDMDMHEITDSMTWMADRIEALEDENARLRLALGKALERLEASFFKNAEHAQAAEIIRASTASAGHS